MPLSDVQKNLAKQLYIDVINGRRKIADLTDNELGVLREWTYEASGGAPTQSSQAQPQGKVDTAGVLSAILRGALSGVSLGAADRPNVFGYRNPLNMLQQALPAPDTPIEQLAQVGGNIGSIAIPYTGAMRLARLLPILRGAKAAQVGRGIFGFPQVAGGLKGAIQAAAAGAGISAAQSAIAGQAPQDVGREALAGAAWGVPFGAWFGRGAARQLAKGAAAAGPATRALATIPRTPEGALRMPGAVAAPGAAAGLSGGLQHRLAGLPPELQQLALEQLQAAKPHITQRLSSTQINLLRNLEQQLNLVEAAKPSAVRLPAGQQGLFGPSEEQLTDLAVQLAEGMAKGGAGRRLRIVRGNLATAPVKPLLQREVGELSTLAAEERGGTAGGIKDIQASLAAAMAKAQGKPVQVRTPAQQTAFEAGREGPRESVRRMEANLRQLEERRRPAAAPAAGQPDVKRLKRKDLDTLAEAGSISRQDYEAELARREAGAAAKGQVRRPVGASKAAPAVEAAQLAPPVAAPKAKPAPVAAPWETGQKVEVYTKIGDKRDWHPGKIIGIEGNEVRIDVGKGNIVPIPATWSSGQPNKMLRLTKGAQPKAVSLTAGGAPTQRELHGPVEKQLELAAPITSGGLPLHFKEGNTVRAWIPGGKHSTPEGIKEFSGAWTNLKVAGLDPAKNQMILTSPDGKVKYTYPIWRHSGNQLVPNRGIKPLEGRTKPRVERPKAPPVQRVEEPITEAQQAEINEAMMAFGKGEGGKPKMSPGPAPVTSIKAPPEVLADPAKYEAWLAEQGIGKKVAPPVSSPVMGDVERQREAAAKATSKQLDLWITQGKLPNLLRLFGLKETASLDDLSAAIRAWRKRASEIIDIES